MANIGDEIKEQKERNLEDEINELKARNNQLVLKVQSWKMTAAQRENEKCELMKEINDLRLKLSRLRSGGAAQARKLDAELQSASEEALTNLVQASSAVARTMELVKAYMREKQNLDALSPRWSNLSATPSTEKIHKVRPTLMGGRSLQPVVSLTPLNSNNSRAASPNNNITMRPLPMHMLQDVYIPLTRIDVANLNNSLEAEMEADDAEDSAEDIQLDENIEGAAEDSQNMSEDDVETSRRLDMVPEDLEPEEEIETPLRNRMDNPLEGPSWLLDVSSNTKYAPQSNQSSGRVSLEPDSTTGLEDSDQVVQNVPSLVVTLAPDRDEVADPDCNHRRPSAMADGPADGPAVGPVVGPASGPVVGPVVGPESGPVVGPAVSPVVGPAAVPSPAHVTVRRKRPWPSSSLSQAARSPRLHDTAKSRSNGCRILKVILPKMRLDAENNVGGRAGGAGAVGSPPKTPMRFDAPSPNGATVPCVVSEQTKTEPEESGVEHEHQRPSTSRRRGAGPGGRGSRGGAAARGGGGAGGEGGSRGGGARRSDSDGRGDSDSGGERADGSERPRRPRRHVTYKEKPLNVKLRR